MDRRCFASNALISFHWRIARTGELFNTAFDFMASCCRTNANEDASLSLCLSTISLLTMLIARVANQPRFHCWSWLCSTWLDKNKIKAHCSWAGAIFHFRTVQQVKWKANACNTANHVDDDGRGRSTTFFVGILMGAKVIALARVHAHTTCTALHCTALPHAPGAQSAWCMLLCTKSWRRDELSPCLGRFNLAQPSIWWFFICVLLFIFLFHLLSGFALNGKTITILSFACFN